MSVTCLGAVPVEKRRIAPAPGNVDVGALGALVNRGFDVDGGRNIHAVVGHRHFQPVAFQRAGNQATRIIFVFLQSFFVKKFLLLGDKNRHLMADVIVAVGDQYRLIWRAHGAPCLSYRTV